MLVSEAINVLVPHAEHRGFLDDNTRESYDKLQWNDHRPKPKWEDIAALLDKPSAKEAAVLERQVAARVDKFVLQTALALAQKAGDTEAVALIQERLGG